MPNPHRDLPPPLVACRGALAKLLGEEVLEVDHRAEVTSTTTHLMSDDGMQGELAGEALGLWPSESKHDALLAYVLSIASGRHRVGEEVGGGAHLIDDIMCVSTRRKQVQSSNVIDEDPHPQIGRAPRNRGLSEEVVVTMVQQRQRVVPLGHDLRVVVHKLRRRECVPHQVALRIVKADALRVNVQLEPLQKMPVAQVRTILRRRILTHQRIEVGAPARGECIGAVV